MTEFSRGTTFTFRYHRAWQFWKRGYGAAQVLAVDGEVLHLRVFGDECLIAHMPIERRRVERFVVGILSTPTIPAGLEELGQSAVSAWYDRSGDGIAGVFAVPIGEAIDLIMKTIDSGGTAPFVIESAYPLFRDGTWQTVHVIMAGG